MTSAAGTGDLRGPAVVSAGVAGALCEDRRMARTWVIIPMYNEGRVVEEVVRTTRETFPHVVCIDDGSSDESAEAALAGGAVVVRHPINMGQGAALQTGFDYALSDPLMSEVVTFDADGQHQVSDAVEMVAKLRAEGLDVVIGSRFLDDRTEVGRLKKAVLKTAALYTRWTSGMALTDAHNGLRVLDRSLLEHVRIQQNRMAHASELVDKIGRAKVRWAEHPTHIIYSDYSKAKGQSLLNSVNILFELIFR
jgi:glycosyltransferase involved in cell wall biosynthesis